MASQPVVSQPELSQPEVQYPEFHQPGSIIEAEYSNPQADLEDEANDTGSIGSSLTSITSSILKGKVEDGRIYAVYGKEEYGLPMDDMELERIDACHAKYYALLDKRRYLAPIGDRPQRALDLGCGTGIWTMDFADANPSAEVLGTDIAATQPHWMPPNCRFEIDDIEAEWTWSSESFDYIFARDLIASIRNWPRLIDQCYTHLKPGGWVEFQSVTGVLSSDDNTVPKDSALGQFGDALFKSTQKYGTPIDDPTRWKKWMEERGFEKVTQVVYKMPINHWARDRRLKIIGTWEMQNLLTGVDSMVTRVFKAMGWTSEQITVFLAAVRRDIRNPNYHAYWPFIVVYGRKPEEPVD